jgi:hypothetical protein
MAAVDAVPTYPLCSLGGVSKSTAYRVELFRDVLEMFIDKEKVKAWRTKGTKTVKNMLTLTATLHSFYTAGAFALRPIIFKIPLQHAIGS